VVPLYLPFQPIDVVLQEGAMWRERALKVVLVVVGLLFLAGVYPIVDSLWHETQASIGPMMLSLYVTLGVFLLMAVRNPSAHRSVIAFTAWSSFAHAAVMAMQAVRDVSERAHLLGGVAGLVVIGVALIALNPAKPSVERVSVAVL
jgi:uncharacterized membrane protein HdeD (DUF308 family)